MAVNVVIASPRRAVSVASLMIVVGEEEEMETGTKVEMG